MFVLVFCWLLVSVMAWVTLHPHFLLKASKEEKASCLDWLVPSRTYVGPCFKANHFWKRLYSIIHLTNIFGRAKQQHRNTNSLCCCPFSLPNIQVLLGGFLRFDRSSCLVTFNGYHLTLSSISHFTKGLRMGC